MKEILDDFDFKSVSKGALFALIPLLIGYAIGTLFASDKPTIPERLDQIEARLDAIENGGKPDGN